MFEEDQPKNAFEKGSYVFGKCEGELPWPAKITKIVDENYSVKFINHRSNAVLTEDCLLAFNEDNILQVMEDYKSCDKSTSKVSSAIRTCKQEIENIRKKMEKQMLTAAKKGAKKKANEPALNSEVSDHNKSRNQEKKTKNLKKISKEETHEATPALESKQENELANRYIVQNDEPQQAKKYEDFVKELTQEAQQNLNLNEEISSLSDEEARPKYENALHEAKQKVEEDTSSQNHHAIHPATTDPILVCDAVDVVSEPVVEVITEQVQPIVDAMFASQMGVNENIVQSSSILPNCTSNSMEVEYSSDYQSVQVDDPEKLAIDRICFFLSKMIDYLTGRLSTPLSKDEKLQLGFLLQNHRKLYYDHVLLDNMVAFLKAFDFKLKEERKNCIIEYVKIKERVETACFLRDQLNYDEKTLEILNKYSPQLNYNF